MNNTVEDGFILYDLILWIYAVSSRLDIIFAFYLIFGVCMTVYIDDCINIFDDLRCLVDCLLQFISICFYASRYLHVIERLFDLMIYVKGDRCCFYCYKQEKKQNWKIRMIHFSQFSIMQRYHNIIQKLFKTVEMADNNCCKMTLKFQQLQFFFIIITTKMKKILCVLTINPDFTQFAIPELKSLLHDCPIPLDTLFQDEIKGKDYKHHYEINHNIFKYFPFIVLNVPNYEEHQYYFKQVAKGAVMTYKMILLISSAATYDELIKNGDEELLKRYSRNDQQLVACDFYSHNRILHREDQIANIHKVLGGLNVRGKINFKQPKVRYQLVQQHSWYQGHHKQPYQVTLRQVFFGIELGRNKIATAKFNSKFQLNKRIYLGPTSTDNDLAFMMCNQALVKSGSVVIDPFVGTGGLLIPAASKGAITFGSDLDIRVINGYAVGRINKKSPYYDADKKFEIFTPKINLNFEQYELNIPNIIRIDSTRMTFRDGQFFDAIITDPPYGIRAMSRTVTKKNAQEGEKEQKQDQIQLKQEETLVDQRQVQEQNEEEDKQQQKESYAKVEISEAQLAERARKRQKRKILKENKRKRKANMPQEEKEFKLNLMKKLNRERVDQWQKYDKGKIEATERQKIFAGLLAFARKYLRRAGRLVFLFPIYEEQEYLGVQNLPSHDGFTVVDLSENKMSKGNSRILVTLQKQ